MPSQQLEFHQERSDPSARLAHIREHPFPISLLLDEINDPRNLGSIFRLADACRIKRIYGFGEMENAIENRKLKRYARSANNWIPYTGLKDLSEVKEIAKQLPIVALEVTSESIPHTQFIPPEEMILLIGNERNGVREELLDLCHQSIHLPMHGLNTSMNVSVATGIALYTILAKLKLH